MIHGPHFQSPNESERIGVDFTNRIADGDSVASAAITAWDEDGTNVTSTIVESGTQTLSGNTVSVRIKSLTDAAKYLLKILATTGNGEIKQETVLLIGRADAL